MNPFAARRSDRPRKTGTRLLPAFALTALGAAGCEHDLSLDVTSPLPTGGAEVQLAQAPPMPEGMFPCSDCHEPDLPVNTTVRKLTTAHTDIELRHGGERMWCFDCHDVKNRDQLHAADGSLFPHEEAERLCGQCHGHQLRDWQNGAHGRRTGSWSGTSTALRCVHCHDAHTPHFQLLKPMPAPPRPERTK